MSSSPMTRRTRRLNRPLPLMMNTPQKRRRASTSSTPDLQTPPPLEADSFESSSSLSTTRLLDSSFLDLGVPPCELRPSATLTTGQCFHWKALANDNDKKDDYKVKSAWGSHNATEWIGTVRINATDSAVFVIRETPDTTLYRVLHAPSDFDGAAFLRDYFQLEHSLADLYDSWSSQCNRLSQVAACLPGVRVVRQDPWECLVSFLCSSNNNIPRITKMLQAIRKTYGEPLMQYHDGETLYSFPSLERLAAAATDEELRSTCGMGYRAKYLLETVKLLQSLGGEQYLYKLRDIKDPLQVQEALVQFCGVGPKVADCVALFSLDQSDAIPVDVHVYEIAKRDYDTTRALATAKSMTPTLYKQVGELFRSRFQVAAGWAHSLLFVAELPSFRTVLPETLLQEMDQFRLEEDERKKAAKEERKKRKG